MILFATATTLTLPAFAQTDDAKPDTEKTDPAKDEQKKDPSDIRNSIGNLNLIRGTDNLNPPPPKGIWEELVNQPYFTPEMRARKLLFHGQYESAETAYRTLLEKAPQQQKFLEGLAESILSQGHASDIKRFENKIAQFTDEQRNTPKMTRLRAQSLLFNGKNSEACQLLKNFTDVHAKLESIDGNILATLNFYARLLESEAEYAAAIGIYTQIVDQTAGQLPDDPQSATEMTAALYRASLLTASGREKNPTVLAQLGTIEQKNQTYWPSRLLTAEVLLAAHKETDGSIALNEVLALNPNDLHARFLAVDFGIASYNFDIARTQLDELKKRTDGALVDAYEGRLLLKERLPQSAVAPLLAAVQKNPNLAEARGWLAGAYYLLGFDETRMNKQLQSIKAPTPSGLHPVALFEAAEVLRDARQFTQAEKLYLKAADAAKWWAEPAASLASLYLETGHEDKAKTLFEQAFKIDPYNVRVLNQLKLLANLHSFETMESKTRLAPGSDLPAFIIRYEKQDEILANLALEWMEKIRPEVWSYFNIQSLSTPTIIEFFPSHEEFGVRTVGLPWIGTVGASTGNVIALDVPRGGAKGLMGAFDWARVLRHEYTHTVTLAMTNNRIPHWLTEACACEQEQAPRDWENCQLLWLNYRSGDLFKIANLNWGFIKPKRTTDRQLAYMQSQWLYQYLVSTYGLPQMLDFLNAFRDGNTEAQAWQKVYNKSMDDIDQEFHTWAGQQITSWGLSTTPLPKREALLDALKKDPKNVDSLVDLASLEAMSGQAPQARKRLEQALEFDPKNLRTREFLGALLSQSKGATQKADIERAKSLLESVLKDDPNRSLAVRSLGMLAMARRDYNEAELYFKTLQSLVPLDVSSYTSLAGIYLIRKDYPAAIAQLLELQRHEQRDERIPRRLAALFKEQHQLAEAEQSAYRAIRINPYNAINHELMAQILVESKQPQRSIEYWSNATTLQPKVAAFWEGLAEAKGSTGDLPGAAEAAKKALDLQPKSPAAKWLKE